MASLRVVRGVGEVLRPGAGRAYRAHESHLLVEPLRKRRIGLRARPVARHACGQRDHGVPSCAKAALANSSSGALRPVETFPVVSSRMPQPRSPLQPVQLDFRAGQDLALQRLDGIACDLSQLHRRFLSRLRR